MAQRERTNREKTEELEESSHKKKAREPLYDQLKAPDEGVVGFQAEPSLEKHASLLANAHSDKQRAHLVIQLQQSYGNAYVQRLLSSKAMQAKLVVNPPDDQYEREADRVADVVAQTSVSEIQRQEEEEEEEPLQAKAISQIQRQPIEEEEEELMMKPASEIQRQEEEEEEEPLQAKAISQIQRQPIEEEEEELQAKAAKSQHLAVANDLEAQINAARGSNQPLADSVRASLEPRLGHDFSEVRIHTDAEADRISRKLGAEAFTTGHDVFFREGAYQPATDSGKKLIAHELTHVVQQEGGTVPVSPLLLATPVAMEDKGKTGTGILDVVEIGAQTTNLKADHVRELDLLNVEPHAFKDKGKKGQAKVHWAGGKGGMVNQYCGAVTQKLPKIKSQKPPSGGGMAKAWVRPGTGKATVTRSYKGVLVGANGSYYITASAAARIDTHEEKHINSSKSQHDTYIVPLEERIAQRTGKAKAMTGATVSEPKTALINFLNWNSTITNFQTADTNANKPYGTVDTTDMASADFYADYGARKVGKKNYAHYIDTPPGPGA